MRRVLLAVAVAGALLAAPAAASAVVVYTNFGPGDSFDTGGFPLRLFGPTHASGVVQHWAATFTPGSEVFLDSVEVALEHAEGSASVLVRVTGDDSGLPDLSFLEEVAVLAPDDPAIVTANFSGSTQLSAGVPYWVWLMAEGDGLSDWYGNDQGIVGAAQFISMGEPSAFELTEATTPAFRVNGTLVPEPTSAALLALASLMFLRRRHTRRFE